MRRLRHWLPSACKFCAVTCALTCGLCNRPRTVASTTADPETLKGFGADCEAGVLAACNAFASVDNSSILAGRAWIRRAQSSLIVPTPILEDCGGRNPRWCREI